MLLGKIRCAAVALELERRPERPVNCSSAAWETGIPTQAQVIVLDCQGQRYVLVGADIIWFSDVFAEGMRERIASRAGTDADRVALAATHTHGTANCDPRFSYGEFSDDFVAHLEQKLLSLLEAALANEGQNCRFRFGRADVPGLSVHRRRMAWSRRGLKVVRGIQNRPNTERAIDRNVSLLVLENDAGSAEAAIVHFTCHPVTDPKNLAGADFPGALRRELSSILGQHVPIIFLQGFCGDIRPDFRSIPSDTKSHLVELINGPAFRSSKTGDTEIFAKCLASAAKRALDDACLLHIDGITSNRKKVPLRYLGGVLSGRSLDVTTWCFGDKLRFDFASAEMLSGFASSAPGRLSVGYANGMAGYIAPDIDQDGGGYEVEGSLSRFGLRDRLSPDLDPEIRAALSMKPTAPVRLPASGSTAES